MDLRQRCLHTVCQILKQSCRIKDKLNLPSIVCVFDQAIYAKACEVVWKKQEIFKDVVLMLSNFHFLMMFLGVIGKRFGDAGLRNLVVQSGIISGRSVDKALDGHIYNRAVRMHKLVYEALMRILITQMKANLSDTEDLNAFEFQIRKSVDGDSFDSSLAGNDFCDVFEMVIKYKEHLSSGSMQNFWISYLEMVELLLKLIYAQRAGD